MSVVAGVRYSRPAKAFAINQSCISTCVQKNADDLSVTLSSSKFGGNDQGGQVTETIGSLVFGYNSSRSLRCELLAAQLRRRSAPQHPTNSDPSPKVPLRLQRPPLLLLDSS